MRDKTIRILIDDYSETCSIACPNCHRERSISTEEISKGGHRLRIKCRCQQMFELVTNRRRFERHTVNLNGDLMECATHKKVADITITSLSVEGLGFLVQDVESQLGDTFTVAFSLDDEKETAIVDEIVVSNIGEGTVGAKFLARNGYNPDIDFYLMYMEE